VREARQAADVLLDALTRQRALLDGLFARVPEAIVLLDPDDRVLQVNPEFTRVFGYAQEEACGCLISELVVPEESLAEVEEYTRRRLRGESLNVEGVRKHKDGTRVYVSILSAPVSIAGSQICEYVIYRDIAERKRAEQRLCESEAYLAEAQRLSQTGSWAWSPATGDIRYWSETCYRVLGFDPGGPLPRFEVFFRRIHPQDQAALRERFDKAIRDKANFELDYRIVHPEKGNRDIHAVGHAVLDGSGNLGEFVGTVIDVTERNRAEQELRQREADLRTKNDRLELLLNLTNQITSNLEFRELLRAISANIRRVMRCDMVAITLPDGPSKGQRLLALDFPNGKGLIKEGLLLTPLGPGGRALESLKPTLVSPLDPDAFSPEVRESAIAEGLQQHCVIPLANRGRALGALVLARTTDVSFSSDELEFLAQVSGQIAIAVENALAFQEVSGLRDRLQLLLNLTTKITSSLDLREVLRAVAANIRELIHADAVTVSLPDATSGKFKLFAVDFPHGQGVIKEELLFTPGAAGRKAVDTMKPVVGYAPELDERESSEVRDIAAAEGMKAFCLIPLVSRGRVLGILSILRTTEAQFTPEDVDLLTQASGQIAIAVENALAYRQISEFKDKLALEKLYLEEEIRIEMNFESIVGNSPALKCVLELVETVAPSDSTVLLSGETGTGKELIARAIHERSRRKDRTFVRLNCAAIPTGLLESELFGHEKGAFTGAITQRVGRFELANRGTIFLDEVGEIPLELQPKLLRVLQEREFERLGSSRTVRTDARLIAATNRDLKTMVQEQKFRSDLYYRLNVFPIKVPALRERKEDIPLLVRHFVKEFSRRNQRVIDTILSESMQALINYHWPGNIRELQNVIERAVLISKGPILNVSLAELNPELNPAPGPSPIDGRSAPHESLQNMVEWTERHQILCALEETNGVISGPNGAAARLGVKRSTLQHKMRRLGIRLSRTAADDGGRTLPIRTVAK
jgi:formate hydrogenlyase transcriptional activator